MSIVDNKSKLSMTSSWRLEYSQKHNKINLRWTQEMGTEGTSEVSVSNEMICSYPKSVR